MFKQLLHQVVEQLLCHSLLFAAARQAAQQSKGQAPFLSSANTDLSAKCSAFAMYKALYTAFPLHFRKNHTNQPAIQLAKEIG
jgi:hypothetical protein